MKRLLPCWRTVRISLWHDDTYGALNTSRTIVVSFVQIMDGSSIEPLAPPPHGETMLELTACAVFMPRATNVVTLRPELCVWVSLQAHREAHDES